MKSGLNPPKGAAVPIGIRSLVKAFGDVTVLDRVSLDIAAGEFLTLLGPSGSGKSTLLMAIAGFSRPSAGNIHFGARDVTLLEPRHRNIGVVFQNYALFPHMTVAANVGYPLKLRKAGKTEITKRVAWALSLVKLDGYGERRIDQLSGGQRQRVALARAVVFEPDVLLMDEPLSALDKKLREHMQIEIRRLHDQLKVTTIYVTHDQREALTMSDRIAVINHGRFEQVGTPRAIYETPANSFVADFIGDAVVLPLEGERGRRTLHGMVVQSEREIAGEGLACLVVRPEKLRLSGSGGPQPRDGWNYFSGVVTDAVYQGDSILLGVMLEGGQQIYLRQRDESGMDGPNPGTGSAVGVGLHARDALIVPLSDLP
ncbi:ABC transporter ATP-binding protein [Aestuariivirga sp.]|uniref:ABC transporter ATP-binding protein n=1 Tax=Aestuariivirga sp. TaxID=2650926 RepID=UPI003BA9FB42